MKSEFLRYLNVKTHEFIDQKDLGLMMKKADIAITR
jgi:ubiquinone/menaquinone biosynthesis C-methylase UbiE